MITFNTGRWYTDNGQRIAAEETPAGGILFVDVDRHIDGYITPEVRREYELHLNQYDVMWAYDNHGKTQYWANVHGQDERRVAALREAARALPAPKEKQ